MIRFRKEQAGTPAVHVATPDCRIAYPPCGEALPHGFDAARRAHPGELGSSTQAKPETVAIMPSSCHYRSRQASKGDCVRTCSDAHRTEPWNMSPARYPNRDRTDRKTCVTETFDFDMATLRVSHATRPCRTYPIGRSPGTI